MQQQDPATANSTPGAQRLPISVEAKSLHLDVLTTLPASAEKLESKRGRLQTMFLMFALCVCDTVLLTLYPYKADILVLGLSFPRRARHNDHYYPLAHHLLSLSL